MIVLIEGPDGSGKTTIAKILSKQFNLPYVHGTYTDPSTFKFYNEQLAVTKAVIDRSFISELIYSKVLGRKPRINKFEADALLRVVEEKCLLIYCDASYELIVDRAFARGEDFVNQEQLKTIYNEYEEYFAKTSVSYLSARTYFCNEFVKRLT